jgi:hypothetical protein
VNPRTIRAALRTMEEFAGKFASATVTSGGHTFAVTFNGQPRPETPKEKTAKKEAAKTKVARNPLEALNETPPAGVFEFEALDA